MCVVYEATRVVARNTTSVTTSHDARRRTTTSVARRTTRERDDERRHTTTVRTNDGARVREGATPTRGGSEGLRTFCEHPFGWGAPTSVFEPPE